jgi:hypothetical protein
MKANPGGLVSPKNVIGRDRFIERLWSTLEQLGVVLVAERRMGKTSIINKMKAEPQPDTLVLLSDVQGASRPLEFVERLIWDIGDHLSTATKTAGWLKQLWTVRTLVKLMQRDHYLRQEEDGAYAFRFDLIRRWWRLDLGLS